MPIATPTTSAARIVKEASRPPPGKTHLLFSEALALAYKPPPGDSRDYATRKASNEDCRRVDRFPTDRFEHVPTVTVPDPAKDFQRNDWLYWNQELEELERGLERSEEVKKFCTSPQAYVWSDAADLTQVLMDTLFKWLQSFFDTHKLRSADCPLWAKYPLRLTTQPPNGAPRHDSMVYLTGEQFGKSQVSVVVAIRPWISLTALADEVAAGPVESDKDCGHFNQYSGHAVMHDLTEQIVATSAPMAMIFTGQEFALFKTHAWRQSGEQDAFWHYMKGTRRSILFRVAKKPIPSASSGQDFIRDFVQCVSDPAAQVPLPYILHWYRNRALVFDLNPMGPLLKRLINCITVTGACPSPVIAKINETTIGDSPTGEPQHGLVYVAFGSAIRTPGDAVATNYVLRCNRPAMYQGSIAKTYSATLTWLASPFVFAKWACAGNKAPEIQQGMLYTIDAGLLDVLFSYSERSGASILSHQRVFVKLPNTRRSRKQPREYLSIVNGRFKQEREVWDLDAQLDSGSNIKPRLFPRHILSLKLSRGVPLHPDYGLTEQRGVKNILAGTYPVTQDHGFSFETVNHALASAPDSQIWAHHPNLRQLVSVLKATGKRIDEVIDALYKEAEEKLARMHAIGLVHLSIQPRNLCVKLKSVQVNVQIDGNLSEPPFPELEVQFIDFERSKWDDSERLRTHDTSHLHDLFKQVRKRFAHIRVNCDKVEAGM